jgi:D-tyrosyl-tRNA(Tyr) deacylase
VILAGVAKTDTVSEVDFLSDKVLGLRIFPDGSGKMNRNVVDAGGSLLVVSQFTLYGDCRKGRRPSFDEAAPPEHAQALYNCLVEKLRLGPVPVETGLFQAMMEVHLVNQGPVTILMDTADRNKK